MFIHKYANYSSLSAGGKDSFVGMLTIDGESAASMEGFYNEKLKSVELPRLSINEKFGWYSPGLILLNESIKRFGEDDKVRTIDLTRGIEKYKFDMGGAEYDTMIFKVVL